MEELEAVISKATHDESAFRELYDATVERVFRYLLVRTKSRAASADISQNVYIALWKALPGFRYQNMESFWGFLFTIVRRELIRAKHKRAIEDISLDEVFDIAAPTEDHEDYRKLLEATSTLPEKESLVISLRYFSDESFAGIAAMLSITENYAKVLHHRAIEKLRAVKKYYV